MSCPSCNGSGFDILDGGQCEECCGSGEVDCIYCEDGHVIVDEEDYDCGFDEAGFVDIQEHENNKDEDIDKEDIDSKELINPVEFVKKK